MKDIVKLVYNVYVMEYNKVMYVVDAHKNQTQNGINLYANV